jgi:hypothetical protein
MWPSGAWLQRQVDAEPPSFASKINSTMSPQLQRRMSG